MVSQRDEVMQRRSEELNRQADVIEQIIEQRIHKGDSRVVLGFRELPDGTTLDVIDVVRQRYVAAGWRTKIVDDRGRQRYQPRKCEHLSLVIEA